MSTAFYFLRVHFPHFFLFFFCVVHYNNFFVWCLQMRSSQSSLILWFFPHPFSFIWCFRGCLLETAQVEESRIQEPERKKRKTIWEWWHITIYFSHISFTQIHLNTWQEMFVDFKNSFWSNIKKIWNIVNLIDLTK